MPSPLERVAAQMAHDATLPSDNWLARRVQSIESHAQSVSAVLQTIGNMGALLLNGRVGTNLSVTNFTKLQGTDPTKYVGSSSYILQTVGTPQQWRNRDNYDFTPDIALQVRLDLIDRYNYSIKGKRPSPIGQVALNIYTRSWGSLHESEIEDIKKVPGAWAEYGDIGFNRRGTLLGVQLTPGETLSTEQAETILAPLASHVINYADIMGFKEYPNQPTSGNFTSGPGARQTRSDAEIFNALKVAPLNPNLLG